MSKVVEMVDPQGRPSQKQRAHSLLFGRNVAHCALRWQKALCKKSTLMIEQIQISFIGKQNLGSGTLILGPRKYGFSIAGLRAGDIGVPKMEAFGSAYMHNIADFPGTYLQARYGIAVTALNTGELWLQNSRGVVLQLNARHSGVALSLGGGTVYIDFDLREQMS
jgi:hypothetical protein